MQTKLSVFCDKLIEAGWLASAAVIPAFFNVYSSRVFEPDKTTLLRVIVLIMAVAWVIKVLETATNDSSLRESFPQFLKFSPLTVPVLIFTAIYILATLASITPSVSFWGSYQRMQGTLVNLAYITLFFLTAYHLRTRSQLDRLINTILFTSVVVALYGILQHEKLDPLPWGGDVTVRVTSSLGNSIFLAAYLIMVVPLTLGRLYYSLQPYIDSFIYKNKKTPEAPKKPLLVALYSVILLVQLVTIIWTQSRGPWLGLLAGLAFMLVIFPLRHARKKLAGSFLGLFAAVVAFIVLLNMPGTPFYSLGQVSPYLHRLGTIADVESGTNKVRMLIWFGDGVGKGSVGLITSNPVRTLVGWGPESMYVAYNPFYPPDLAHLEARNATPDRSHNDFLDFLVTTGIIGLASYLAIVGIFFFIGIKRLWQTSDRYEQLIILAFLAAVVAHLVESLTGIAIAATRTHFWLYVAGVASLAAYHRLGSTSVSAPEAAITAVLAGSTVSAPTKAPTFSSPPQSQRKGRNQSSVKSQTPARSTAAVSSGKAGFKLTSGSYQMIAYIVSIVVGVPFLLTKSVGQSADPSVIVIAGFVWLLVGLFVTAQWVDRPFKPGITWRSQNWWIYVPGVLITLFICVFVFLSVIIGDIYYKKGLSMESSNRFDLAVPAYLDAIRWAPTQDFYFLFLGRAYNELAKTAPADAKTAIVVEKASDLFTFGPAQIQIAGRETTMSAAVVALEKARELAPLNTDNSANLGRIYQYWAETTPGPQLKQSRYDKALAYYEEATRLSPNTAHLQFEWGRVYHSMGLLDEAIKKYNYAIQLDSEYDPTYIYLGDIYRQNKDYDKAIEMYLTAIAKDDSLVTAHSGLAFVYHEQGKIQESLDENLKAVKYAPKDLASLRNIAIIYFELEDIDHALEWADKALKIAPQDQQQAIKSFIADLQSRKK